MENVAWFTVPSLFVWWVFRINCLWVFYCLCGGGGLVLHQWNGSFGGAHNERILLTLQCVGFQEWLRENER